MAKFFITNSYVGKHLLACRDDVVQHQPASSETNIRRHKGPPRIE